MNASGRWSRLSLVCRRSTLSGGLSLALWVTAMPLALPAVTRGEDLPKAEQIIEEYIEATGGREAREKLHSRITRGYLEFLNMGMKLSMITYAAEPNLAYVELESESMGSIREGSNGEIAWEISTMQGSSVSQGEAKAFKMREAAFHGETRWKELYEKAECVGAETLNERRCYKVVLTPKEGKPITRYYDAESHLLVKSEFTYVGPMGELDVSVVVSDYREVDGIKIAHRAEQSLMGQTQVIVTEGVEHNVEIPKERFDLPDEIEALVEKDKNAGTGKPASAGGAETTVDQDD